MLFTHCAGVMVALSDLKSSLDELRAIVVDSGMAAAAFNGALQPPHSLGMYNQPAHSLGMSNQPPRLSPAVRGLPADIGRGGGTRESHQGAKWRWFQIK